MKIKKITFFAISATIIALSSSANAKFISPSEGYKSKVLSEKASFIPKEYKRCRSESFAANLSDDYASAIASDPLEPYNRVMHKINNSVDKAVLTPTARAYRYVMPNWGRDRVSSIFQNLEEPRNFTNAVLQADGKAAFTAFWRFALNSTIGIAGMHDVAKGFGLPLKEKDFSSTLAYYGVGSGPYFVAPILGPSTMRDFVAMAPDAASSPSSYADGGISASAKAVEVVAKREKIMDITDDLEKNSFDLYSSYKSGYLQNRKKSVEKSLTRE
jgi:phospholipid-binding lipoprotein MlaA